MDVTGTRKIIHTDPYGRKFDVLIPEDAPTSEAEYGFVLGPPDLSPLGLPIEIEISLHNALHARGIITADDAHRNPNAIAQAVLAAAKLQTGRIAALYEGLA